MFARKSKNFMQRTVARFTMVHSAKFNVRSKRLQHVIQHDLPARAARDQATFPLQPRIAPTCLSNDCFPSSSLHRQLMAGSVCSHKCRRPRRPTNVKTGGPPCCFIANLRSQRRFSERQRPPKKSDMASNPGMHLKGYKDHRI